jgi:hypothetical protein
MAETKFQHIKEDVIHQLEKVSYKTGDMSDIGNEIGIAIAKHLDLDGFDVDSFISGFKHGISLIDGTH